MCDVSPQDEDFLDVFHEWADAATHVVSADGHKCTSSERMLLWAESAINVTSSLSSELQQARAARNKADELARVFEDELKVTQSSLEQARQLVRALQVLQVHTLSPL